MRVLHLFVFIILLSGGCKPTVTRFDSLKGQSHVVINLSDYQLDSVPPEIQILRGVKSLTISKDADRWTAYPPLSKLGEEKAIKLPDELLELASLQNLVILNIHLKSLPNNLERLQSLDTLRLIRTNLRIADEITRLKKLRTLKYLDLSDNTVESGEIDLLMRAIPGLTVSSEYKQY